jgi:hypothetical protein
MLDQIQSMMAIHTDSNYQTRDFSFISSNTLRFSSGDGVGTVRCFTVGIIDDTRVENDEYFTVSLFSGSRTRVAQGIAIINILDNDGEKLTSTE